MTKKVSAVITDESTEKVVKKVENPKHYVGTYTESQLKAGAANHIIDSLQDQQHFPNLKYVNHRLNKVGKTEVWLSAEVSPYTINK